jgi:hypothetical protein
MPATVAIRAEQTLDRLRQLLLNSWARVGAMASTCEAENDKRHLQETHMMLHTALELSRLLEPQHD